MIITPLSRIVGTLGSLSGGIHGKLGLLARIANLRGGVPKQPEAVLKGVRVTVTTSLNG